jgi:hypothetical protein
MIASQTARVLCLGALFGIMARSGLAQGFEIFEVDDFVDPKELRLRGTEESMEFFASQLYGGIGHNYQFRNEPVKQTFEFLQSANSFYYDMFGAGFQTNMKLTGLLSNGGHDIRSVKARLQEAIYFLSSSYTHGEQAIRLQFSWDIDKQANRDLIHELSMGTDFGLQLPTGGYAIGGVMYAWRGSDHRHFFSASARIPVKYWDDGSNLRLGVGGAVEGEGFFKTLSRSISMIFIEASVEIQLPFLRSSLHIAYVPSYNFDRTNSNHEVIAFLDVPLFSRLF